MDNLLPNTLSSVSHFKALEQVMEERFLAIDLESSLVYLIDTVSEDALVYLASQFGISSHRDWELATDVATKRDVIKHAIDLKRIYGTPAAIKQAMNIAGFSAATLVENPGNNWGTFKVTLPLGWNVSINNIQEVELQRLVMQYKNVRSLYIGLEYSSDMVETISTLTEEVLFEYYVDVIENIDVTGFTYNGQFTYNGAKKYRDGVEDMQYIITP